MQIRINYRIIIIPLILLYLPLSLALEKSFSYSFLSYGDEVFTLFMMIYILLIFLKNKLAKVDAIIIFFLIVLTFLGGISNLYSKLTNNYFAILIDGFWQWKIFICFIGAKYIAKNDTKNSIIKSLIGVSKLFLLISAIIGIINCFIDLGMSSDVRYGIRSYSFVFGNEGRFGIIVAIALLIVLNGTYSEKIRRKYEILALISMILTTKGTVYIIIITYFILNILFKYIEKKKKLNLKTIIPICTVAVFTSGFQVKNYLFNSISPRMLLIKYGIITANTYFPFGSGLATYGSEMAARYYSPLYVKYGWSNRYSMSIENGFALNDNYLATIIGEFGFFGLIIFLILLFYMFKQVNTINADIKNKSMILSLFICMVVCFLATGITKSSIGVCVFIILGTLKGLNKCENTRKI